MQAEVTSFITVSFWICCLLHYKYLSLSILFFQEFNLATADLSIGLGELSRFTQPGDVKGPVLGWIFISIVSALSHNICACFIFQVMVQLVSASLPSPASINQLRWVESQTDNERDEGSVWKLPVRVLKARCAPGDNTANLSTRRKKLFNWIKLAFPKRKAQESTMTLCFRESQDWIWILSSFDGANSWFLGV